MATRDDYILRFIELLGKALAESVRLREDGRHDQALIALVAAQEKLFARPTTEFAGLTLDEQLRLLTIGEAPASARTKCLGYGALLREAGLVYEARNRPDLAVSAFQLALEISLTVAANANTRDAELTASVEDLLPRIPPEQLYEPTKELLERFAELSETRDERSAQG
jgi:hypothetical protein